MIEVVGKPAGTDPISGTFVEDPWMRLREIHFPPKEDPADTAVITFEGPGAGGDPSATGVTAAGAPVKIGKVTTEKGGQEYTATSWLFDAPGPEYFDNLSSLRSGPFFDSEHPHGYDLDGEQVKAMLLSQYPGRWVKGEPFHVAPLGDDDPTHGVWACQFFVIALTIDQVADTYRTSYLGTLTDDANDPAAVTVGLTTGRQHSSFEVVNINTVRVDGYGPKKPDPHAPPDDPPPEPPKFEIQADGSYKVTNAEKLFSFTASRPDRSTSPPTTVVYRFNKKGVVS